MKEIKHVAGCDEYTFEVIDLAGKSFEEAAREVTLYDILSRIYVASKDGEDLEKFLSGTGLPSQEHSLLWSSPSDIYPSTIAVKNVYAGG